VRVAEGSGEGELGEDAGGQAEVDADRKDMTAAHASTRADDQLVAGQVLDQFVEQREHGKAGASMTEPMPESGAQPAGHRGGRDRALLLGDPAPAQGDAAGGDTVPHEASRALAAVARCDANLPKGAAGAGDAAAPFGLVI